MWNTLSKRHLAIMLGGLIATFSIFPVSAHAAPPAPVDPVLQVDRLWVLISAALVFFMQAGFLALEAGAVRAKSVAITALKNIGDWMICVVVFFFFGWALMFGHTGTGFFGIDGFSLQVATEGGWAGGKWIHFIFQLAFAGTAATIVSGALAERTGFLAYLFVSLIVSAVIYPIFGHWAWGNSFFGNNQTLLTSMGFIDFAGSTVVHSVGGWVSLVGIAIVGPRLGRFGSNGETRHMPHSNVALSALGVIILWIGWWGFNGGSVMALNDTVAVVINNTNIAAAFGGIGAVVYCLLLEGRKDITMKFLAGLLGGMVAITASANIVSPISAVAIGLLAGVLCNISQNVLLKLRLDDPVAAVPVHLVCGIWGTLCVALFAPVEAFGKGYTRLDQIQVQLYGIAICGAWTVSIAYVALKIAKVTIGLRVTAREELDGYDIGGQTVTTAEGAEPVRLSKEAARQLMAKR